MFEGFGGVSIRVCGLFISVSRSSCHSEGSDDSAVSEWRMCNDFRFFTSLRCVRNDRISKPSLLKLCIPLSVHRGGRDIAPPKGGVTECFGERFDLPRANGGSEGFLCPVEHLHLYGFSCLLDGEVFGADCEAVRARHGCEQVGALAAGEGCSIDAVFAAYYCAGEYPAAVGVVNRLVQNGGYGGLGGVGLAEHATDCGPAELLEGDEGADGVAGESEKRHFSAFARIEDAECEGLCGAHSHGPEVYLAVL